MAFFDAFILLESIYDLRSSPSHRAGMFMSQNGCFEQEDVPFNRIEVLQLDEFVVVSLQERVNRWGVFRNLSLSGHSLFDLFFVMKSQR